MQISELINVEKQKKELINKREKLIRTELKKKQRDRANLDQSSLKKGFIEKTKIIQKKKFETVVQKARKIEVKIQDNVNVNTFISQSSNFINMLKQTKKHIVFNQEKFKEGVTAIASFGISNHEKIMHFTLKFQKNVDCHPRPCQIKLPFRQTTKKLMVILPQIKEEVETNFTKIKDINMELLTLKDFIHKYKNDKQFVKEILHQNIKIYIDFSLFKDKKFIQNLLERGIVIFPIDSKKVPYQLKQTFTDYSDYIKDLNNHYYFSLRSGLEHQIKFKIKPNLDELIASSQQAIYQAVARLLQRNKNKPNRLVKVSVKTASSISIEIYAQ